MSKQKQSHQNVCIGPEVSSAVQYADQLGSQGKVVRPAEQDLKRRSEQLGFIPERAKTGKGQK